MPSVSVQPTGSQNPQNTAVENQSIGHGLFEGWVVVEKGDACIKDLHEKVRSGFSPGRSIGCARYAVKEGISAFSQKPFGKKSKAPTCSSGVEMSPVASENKHAAFVPKKQHNGGNPSGSVERSNVKPKGSEVSVISVPKRNVPVPTQSKPTVGSSGKSVLVSVPSFVEKNSISAVPKENVPNMPPKPTVPREKLPQSTNSQAVASKKNSAMFSTQTTASVKKDAASSSPKYGLADVPGDGYCGGRAVLAGMGAINLLECERPKHGDYGGRPIAIPEQKKIMADLRKRAEREALKAVHTNPSAAGCAARLGLRDKSPTSGTADFQCITQAVGRPIVVSRYQDKVEVYGTICDPKETEPIPFFREDFNNQRLRQGNPIRLYFDGDRYQLMQPIETM